MPRGYSLSARSLTNAERRAAKQVPIEVEQRPRTRGDCLPGGCNEQRPCPYVSCRHHLWADVRDSGSLRLNFPHVPPDGLDQLEETCALDVADRGETSLEDVARLLNLGVERAGQLTSIALQEMRGRQVQDEALVTLRLGTAIRRQIG